MSKRGLFLAVIFFNFIKDVLLSNISIPMPSAIESSSYYILPIVLIMGIFLKYKETFHKNASNSHDSQDGNYKPHFYKSKLITVLNFNIKVIEGIVFGVLIAGIWFVLTNLFLIRTVDFKETFIIIFSISAVWMLLPWQVKQVNA